MSCNLTLLTNAITDANNNEHLLRDFQTNHVSSPFQALLNCVPPLIDLLVSSNNLNEQSYNACTSQNQNVLSENRLILNKIRSSAESS